jgi:hypothetical protein
MLSQTFHILLVGASLALFGTLTDKIPGAIGAASSAILFGVLAINANNIETVTESGSIVQTSEPVFAYLGMGGFGLSVLLLAVFVIQELR